MATFPPPSHAFQELSAKDRYRGGPGARAADVAAPGGAHAKRARIGCEPADTRHVDPSCRIEQL